MTNTPGGIIMKEEERAREVLAVEMERQRDASPTANEWAFILRHVPTLSENGAVLAAIRAMHAFAEPARKMLLDLLCVIHRDGGQHVDAVGLEQAWRDAVELSSERLAFATPSPVIETEGSGADELRHGKDELLRLMDSIWSAEFSREAPNWKPLDDLPGMVSQIDNMYAGVRAQRDQARWALAAERSTDREAVDRVARAVMMWGRPHFKHMVAYSTLCEAIEAALRPVGAENVRESALEEAAKVADVEVGRLNELPRYGCSGASEQYRVQAGTAGKIAKSIRALITPTAGNGEAQG
jgi:hypothetical protein